MDLKATKNAIDQRLEMSRAKQGPSVAKHEDFNATGSGPKSYWRIQCEKLQLDMSLRDERIDELVRSFRDLKEEYEKLMEEREKMLKGSFKAHKISYPDGTFIYRTKSLMQEDLWNRGFERGDELRLVIVKTPLAKIVEKK